MTEVFLKVDIDTKKGFLRGVPTLLEIFRALDIKATFFVSMGPDNSGRAIRRIFRPGFLAKMKRTNAMGTYGFPTLMYGLLWPGPVISASDPSLLLRMAQEGHEVGIHGFDHVLWHDKLDLMQPDAIAQQLDKALALYRDALGQDPQGFAAPGWKWNAKAQELFQRYPFAYTSNTRGVDPFFPAMDAKAYTLLEIPTTLPTLDEVIGNKAQTPDELSSFYLKKLHHHSVHVFTLHAELEGLRYSGWFSNLLKLLKEEGAVFGPLRELARRCLDDKEQIAHCDVYEGQIEGRATDVALQGLAARVSVTDPGISERGSAETLTG